VNNNAVTGLDIGSAKVCAITAEPMESGEYRVVGVGLVPSAGVRKGIIVDVNAASNAVREAIGKATASSGRIVTSVYVGVSGQHVTSLNSTAHIDVPNGSYTASAADIARATETSRHIVLPSDRQIVHTIPRSHTVEAYRNPKSPERDSYQLGVQTHLVHGSTSRLDDVAFSVQKAGFGISERVVQSYATANAVLTPEEKESGICLVDIGAGTSEIAVFVKGTPYHSAVIPVGGSLVTNDIAYGLTVSPAEAERLKVDHGSAIVADVPENDIITLTQVGRNSVRKLRRRALVQIIEPRMDELFQLILEELKAANCLEMVSAGLVLTGGGSLLQGSTDLAKQIFGLPVRLGLAPEILTPENVFNHPRFACAIGLVHYGIVRERKPTDPPEELSGEQPVRTIFDEFVRFVARKIPRS